MDNYFLPLRQLSTQLQSLVRTKLWLQVILGMLTGLLLGLLLGPELGWVSRDTAQLTGNWLALPGLLFLGLVQMIVIPLVCASIILGITANSDLSKLRTVGLAALGIFLATTLLASLGGLTLAAWVEPGKWVDQVLVNQILGEAKTLGERQGLPELSEVPGNLAGLLPRNPFAALAAGDMLQLILFSAVIGVALMQLPGDKAAPLLTLVNTIQAICMTVVSWAMRLAPLAVFGLMVRLTANIGLSLLAGLSIYVLTVLGGLLLLVLFYLVLIRALTGWPALRFLGDARETLLLAFSTSSSAAVMPMSLETAEGRCQVNPAIARFVIPLGATINMTGTALYQGVAIAFMAQVFGVQLDAGAILLLVTMTIAASIGSPAAPGASIVILGAMLESIGIPAAGVTLLLGVDRILDMSRTTLNVLGDLATCLLINRYFGKSL